MSSPIYFLKKDIPPHLMKYFKPASCGKCYICKLLKITAELKRVLKKTGVFFLNWGDCYGSSPAGNKPQNVEEWGEKGDGLYKRLGLRHRQGNSENKPTPKSKLVRQKCLTLQNFRGIIRMIDEGGWILRNTIIWCIIEDTKMFVLRNGKYLHIPIKKVKVGDFVLTLDKKGEFRLVKVKNIFNNGFAPVLKITTKSGREVVCTEEHQFPVKSSYYYGKYLKLRLKKAKDLTTKDFLWINYHLPTILPDGNEKDYQNGYIIGFYLAEGSWGDKRKIGIYKDNKLSLAAQKRWGRLEKPILKANLIQFSCGRKDIEEGKIPDFTGYKTRIYIYGNDVHIKSRDKRIIELIKKYIKGNSCDTKSLTQEAWNTNLKFIKGIIDGFLAGDGRYDKENNRWRIGIKPNQELKDDLMLACRLIGYEFRYEGIRNNNYGTQTMTFAIRKELKRKTFNFLYADQIDKIEKIGEKQVYDIEIEAIYTSYCGKGKSDKPSKEIRKNKWNNLYFLANGVWTHNSKPNHMPSSVKDRFTNSYEPVFMLVKSKKYYFDLDAVRIPLKTFENRPYGIVREREFEYNTLYPEIRKRQNSAAYNWKLRRTPNVMEWRKNAFNYRVRDAEKKSEQCPQFKATKEEIERYKEIEFWLKKLDEGGKQREAKIWFLNWLKEHPTGTYEQFYEEMKSKKVSKYANEGWSQLQDWESHFKNFVAYLGMPHPLGKNPGDLWEIPTQPSPPEVRGKHFATFPEKLVKPMILAGCPAQVCKKCGKAKERIIKRQGTYDYSERSDYAKAQLHMKEPPKNWKPIEHQTIGWTSCNCNVGFEPGIVLDPFMGSGTVAVVAKKLGRNFIGIELNKEYVKIAEERLKKIPNPLL